MSRKWTGVWRRRNRFQENARTQEANSERLWPHRNHKPIHNSIQTHPWAWALPFKIDPGHLLERAMRFLLKNHRRKDPFHHSYKLVLQAPALAWTATSLQRHKVILSWIPNKPRVPSQEHRPISSMRQVARRDTRIHHQSTNQTTMPPYRWVVAHLRLIAPPLITTMKNMRHLRSIQWVSLAILRSSSRALEFRRAQAVRVSSVCAPLASLRASSSLELAQRLGCFLPSVKSSKSASAKARIRVWKRKMLTLKSS